MFPIKEVYVDRGVFSGSMFGPVYKEAYKFREGLTQIGNDGMYAKAWSSDELPFVIKIGWMNDYGYLSYLEILHELELDNPYLPRIHDVTLFLVRGEERKNGVYVVRMEKLQRGEFKNPWSEKDDTPFAQQCRLFRQNATLKLRAKMEPAAEDALAVIQLAFERAQEKVKDISDHTNVRYDLHFYNFLLRGEQMVITDPIAS